MLESFDFPWVRFLGMQITDMADGQCTAQLDPQPVHLNHNGTINAPVLYGAAEFAGGAAVTGGIMHLLAGSYLVAKSAQIDYLAPARGVVTATGTVDPQEFSAARAQIEAAQPAELTAAVEITDGQGRVAVKVRLVMAVRPRRAA